MLSGFGLPVVAGPEEPGTDAPVVPPLPAGVDEVVALGEVELLHAPASTIAAANSGATRARRRPSMAPAPPRRRGLAAVLGHRARRRPLPSFPDGRWSRRHPRLPQCNDDALPD